MLKKVVKVLLEIILVILLIALILIFLSFSAKSEIVPNIYVTSNSGKVALAVKGNYKWNSFSDSIEKKDVSELEYLYLSNNTLLVTPGEKMIFKNSENDMDCYKFYQLEMRYYDESNLMTEVASPEDSKAFADLKYLEVKAPEEEGTYTYNFKFSYYNKGEVSYGLKVIVSTQPNYEIINLIKYKSTRLTQTKAINEILNLLPYSSYKTNLIIRNNDDAKELVVYYKDFSIERKELINNVIALFTLIPELENITLKFENEDYVFTKAEIEKLVGRSLNDYADNMELWEKEVLFKEVIIDEISSRDSIYKAIIMDILSEYEEGIITKVAIDTGSFADTNILKISEVDRKEILEFISDFAEIIYDVNNEEYKVLSSDVLYISLISMNTKAAIINNEISGDGFDFEISQDDDMNEELEGKYICAVKVSINNKTKIYSYEIKFENEKWNITEL